MDKEDIKIVMLILVLTLVGVPILLGIGYPIEKAICLNAYSEYQPKFAFWTGCQIVWDGKLTPVDMVKNISVEK